MFFVNKAHWFYYCRNSDSRIYIVISPVADPNGIHVLTTFVSIFSLQNSKNIHIFCYKRDPFTRYKHTIKMCQLPACANFCGLQHTKISPSYTRLFVVDSDWCDSVWTSDKLPVLKNCLKILTTNWHSWLNMLESYYVPWKKKIPATIRLDAKLIVILLLSPTLLTAQKVHCLKSTNQDSLQKINSCTLLFSQHPQPLNFKS